MSISISFRTEEEIRDQIDRIAAAFDRDRSWVVNEALDQYIDTYQYQAERIEKSLAELSQFAKLEGRKCFGMSEGNRKVFTTRRAEPRQSEELFRRL